jgi:hypothetical protein
MLPKFLLADNMDFPGKVYIVHTKYPRCIIESSVDDFQEDQKIYWLDEEVEDDDELKELLEEAENYFIREMDDLDENYDDD